MENINQLKDKPNEHNLFTDNDSKVKSTEKKLKALNFITNDNNDLKEIVDLHKENDKKSFFLLVKKRLREHDDTLDNKEKFIENFNKLSIDSKSINRADKTDKIFEKKLIFKDKIEDSKNEIDHQDDVIDKIVSKRMNKVFTKNENQLFKKGLK